MVRSLKEIARTAHVALTPTKGIGGSHGTERANMDGIIEPFIGK